MTDQRDPRTDPRPGDRLRKPCKPPYDGHLEQRTVTGVSHSVTFERERGDDDPLQMSLPLSEWRAWAKSATVLKRADQ